MSAENQRRLLILGIVILAALLRLGIVVDAEQHWDEEDYLIAGAAFNRTLSEADWEGITEASYNFEHPPLVKFLYGLTYDPAERDRLLNSIDLDTFAATGKRIARQDISLPRARLQSVTAGTLTVLAVAVISPIGGFVLAIVSIHMFYSSLALLDALPLLFLTLMAIAYQRYHRHRQPAALFWVSAIFFGIAGAGKYPFAIAGVALLAHALVYRHQRLLALIGWGLLAIAVFFILNPYLWPQPIERLEDQLTYHREYAENKSDYHDYMTRVNQLLYPARTWHDRGPDYPFIVPVDAAIFIFAIPGTVILLRQRSYFGWWLVVGFVFLTVWRSQWLQHNMIIMTPYAISAGTGLSWAWRHFRRWVLSSMPFREDEHIKQREDPLSRPSQGTGSHEAGREYPS
ncbi:MAG: hypothetical protein GYB66_02360 [Chloroflexi bacterium]|nr:hypothetical protein [Chloroflexota bacterium]